MNIPEQIKIGCYTYKVIQAEGPILLEGTLGDFNSIGYGNINFDTKIITISKKPNPLTRALDHQTLLQVFLHEVMHGCVNLYDLDVTDKDTDEEVVVDTLSKALLGIIIDNPGIFNHSPEPDILSEAKYGFPLADAIADIHLKESEKNRNQYCIAYNFK